MIRIDKILILTVIFVIFLFCINFEQPNIATDKIEIEIIDGKKEMYIKWAAFNVTEEMLVRALKYDVESNGKIDWINLLAYAVAKNWGNIDDKCLEYIDEASRVDFSKYNDETLKYFTYYKKVYSAVLGNYLGMVDGVYRLKVFHPIAKGYNWSHYKDFGNSRSYGYRREHLGNDIFGDVGTPVICVEDGVVEAIGWNEYGGWRIGIRSNDKRRYYYYAHLRKDHPYTRDLSVGKNVKAGEVIGYLGKTGYSLKENVNNIEVPHLHFGIQLVFDESQKDGSNQIWIDVYNLIEFLEKNKSEVKYDEEEKEYYRVHS